MSRIIFTISFLFSFAVAAKQHTPVDILFVVDNSASMEFEHQSVAHRFEKLLGKINHTDWRIGFVTTECGETNEASVDCGNLVPIDGAPNLRWIDSQTPNALTLLKQTVEREETIGCIIEGRCPNGTEQPLRAVIHATKKQDTINSGFFRANAQFATIILSDEDEQSFGGPNATKPYEVLQWVSDLWPNKKFQSNSIVVKPGDSACLNAQTAQWGASAHYGNLISELSDMTSGRIEDICSEDYSDVLSNVGNQISLLAEPISFEQNQIANEIIDSSVAINGPIYIVSNSDVEAIRFPNLEFVNGPIYIVNNLKLESVSFPKLKFVNGPVYITYNSSLENTDFDHEMYVNGPVYYYMNKN